MINYSRALSLACLLVALLSAVSCGDQPDVYSISVKDLKASPDETIVSFELDVNAGTVEAISNIPVGWQVAIDNDANWISRIKANSTIGAASLAPDELKRLSLTVRRNESPNFKFDLTGQLSLSKTFESRKIPLSMADFALGAVQ